MEKITITQITHYDKDRNGNPLVSKQGKPYTRCIIKTADKTISGFGNQLTHSLKPGDTIEAIITQNQGYLNFSLPPRNVSREEFDTLSKKVKLQGDELELLHNEIARLKLGNKVEEIDLGEPPLDEEPPVEAI